MESKMTFTKNQMNELNHWRYFENCPNQVFVNVKNMVLQFEQYSEDSLKWIMSNADDYADVYGHNSELLLNDSDTKESFKWKRYEKSLRSLYFNIKQYLNK